MSTAIGIRAHIAQTRISYVLSIDPETSDWMLSHRPLNVLVVPPRMAETYGSKRFLFPLSTFLVFENQHLYLQEGQKVATELNSSVYSKTAARVLCTSSCLRVMEALPSGLYQCEYTRKVYQSSKKPKQLPRHSRGYGFATPLLVLELTCVMDAGRGVFQPPIRYKGEYYNRHALAYCIWFTCMCWNGRILALIEATLKSAGSVSLDLQTPNK